MTLAPALVLLSDRDTDTPNLPGIATVSKDDQGDHGAYDLGFAACHRGALWCDRAYFTGNPTVDWLVAKAERVIAAGGYLQLGNELNHPDEGWRGDVEAYHALYAAVAARVSDPSRLLWQPPSPGFDGWQRWIAPAPAYAVHAYGNAEQMQEIVQWYLDHTAGDLFVTECNPGAGNRFDLNAWATGPFRTFLDWCALQPRVRMVAYFAWAWDQSPRLPSSIDARGSAIPGVLQSWRPAAGPTPTPAAPTGRSGSPATPTAQPPAGRSTTMTENPWRGKLLSVWNLPPDPNVLIQAGRNLALDGFEVKIADGDSSWIGSKRHVTREYVDALHSAGFRVCGWSYNYCDGRENAGDRGDGVPEREADAALRAIDALELDGWTADLEIECEGHADLVTVLLDRVRAGTSTPIAAHVWGDLDGHDAYPAAEIVARVDVVRPMIYRPIWEASRFWRSWTPYLAGAIVCPVWGITHGRATADVISQDMAYADEQGCPGEAYWEFSGYPGQPGVRDLIRARSFAGQTQLAPDAIDDALNGAWFESTEMARLEHVDHAIRLQEHLKVLKRALKKEAA